ncbi:hypothetical protein MNBD_ALPHA11-2407 [hydrothermal vent metagenome]|uniref:Uncharacterized protein n=1 Tax=hydrothermal vent metagenome TaxID=652676 RepID=A0A3B0ULG6_9ZZZZ
MLLGNIASEGAKFAPIGQFVPNCVPNYAPNCAVGYFQISSPDWIGP